ncbi:G5 domain-containing protein [Clostridium algoriphilum]|uniref:3D domain-containing protein n=1 Tax=Clostridium algoriphilum TaxID=198347 RepID=UPI001CF14DDD|nr:3D domain-containing protein [Clostridium algoriphilum]MCB2294685.1 G5 domain-containing protein [Clostridium algoriphilum]
MKFIKNKRLRIATELMLVTIIATLSIYVCIIRKNITVVVDGSPINLVTYQKTLGSALKKSNINIDVKDKINKPLNSKIVDNGIITINRAVNIKVFVDNKELNIKSAEKNVTQMLSSQKIAIKSSDKVSPSVQTKLTKGMNVKITRVDTKTIQKSSPIDFSTVFKKDNKMEKSKTNVSQKGVKGEKKITLNVTYENGKEVTRKVVKETLVKKPQNKIIVQGNLTATTYSRGQTSKTSTNVINVKATSNNAKKVSSVYSSPKAAEKTSSRGSSSTSGKVLSVKSTAYSASNGITASGSKTVRNVGGFSTIAVDPNIIPLGTKLYVEGYGNAIAADTGSAIQGNVIDLFFNTNAEACNWGVRYLKVHILN